MEIHHRFVIHFVDMVARQHDHVFGLFAFDGVDVLVNRVSSALVPVVVDPLLGWYDVDEFSQFAAEVIAPSQMDVTIQRLCFVLSQQQQTPHITVQTIAKYKVDDAVQSAKGNGRFGTVACERFQPRAATAR